MRMLITGGSGFIGTNLVELYLGRGVPTVNLDALPPRNPAHGHCWIQTDVRNAEALKFRFDAFRPTHVIHMAARTDLRGQSVPDYDTNTKGVESVIEAVGACGAVERVVYASSMLVCRAGYRPVADNDYAPSTPYGQSKGIGEDVVRRGAPDGPVWSIVRPTSIWGPWFGEPYRDFFQAVLRKWFVKFGAGGARKTFGYVGNTVYQLDALLRAPKELAHGSTFYLGDRPPLAIGEWADQIAAQAGVRLPWTVPLGLARLAARAGDAASRIGIAAPITSFRLSNMTTDNEIGLDDIYAVAGEPPCSVREGIRATLDWLSQPAGRRS